MEKLNIMLLQLFFLSLFSVFLISIARRKYKRRAQPAKTAILFRMSVKRSGKGSVRSKHYAGWSWNHVF